MSNQYSKFLQELVSTSPRRGKGEQKACKIILNYLDKEKISYTKQSFTTQIQVVDDAYLFADEKEISCLGASYVSGEFDVNSPILNSFGAVSDFLAIIFNPISKGVCLQSYKNFPAVAVNRDDIVQLIMADKISGKVNISKESFESTNILVGNLDRPEKIVFAHYDSIVGSGAIDNAGSVDVVFQTIIESPKLTDKNLFVFAGSEEESISSHDGCYGFEMFDQKYKSIIDDAKEIIVLDGIGVSSPKLVNTHIDWVFAISRVNQLSKKIFWLQNDQTLVMQYYHTELDTIDKIIPRYINEAKELLVEKLNN